MLRILGREKRTCNGLTRRDLLTVGGAGLLGCGLASGAEKKKARAKSVLFVYLFGGPSQLETFDMKPDSPSHIRGPFKPISARTSGLRICEHLPKLASRSNEYCVVRSLSHPHNDHNASHYIQTGHPMPPAQRGPSNVNAAPNDWPSMGSVVEYMDRKGRAGRPEGLPSYIYLPNKHGEIQLGGQYDRVGQYAGWLGRRFNATSTRIHKRKSGDNPYYRNCTDEELKYQFPGMDNTSGITLDRLDRRRGLLTQFDASRRQLESFQDVEGHLATRQAAWNMMTSGKMRTALDIRREDAKLRDQYGRNLFGQTLMVGRRMVEAGARFVTVIWDMTDGAASGWDSHDSLTSSLRDHLLPGLDQGMSALLDDMKDRGLLDETLVVCLGEMGRTPQFLNRGSPDGRDHWSYCFNGLFAGAGVQGGTLYGKSDRHGAYPVENTVTPEDLACTVFDSLGIDPRGTLHDPQGRPVRVVDKGHVVEGLFG